MPRLHLRGEQVALADLPEALADEVGVLAARAHELEVEVLALDGLQRLHRLGRGEVGHRRLAALARGRDHGARRVRRLADRGVLVRQLQAHAGQQLVRADELRGEARVVDADDADLGPDVLGGPLGHDRVRGRRRVADGCVERAAEARPGDPQADRVDLRLRVQRVVDRAVVGRVPADERDHAVADELARRRRRVLRVDGVVDRRHLDLVAVDATGGVDLVEDRLDRAARGGRERDDPALGDDLPDLDGLAARRPAVTAASTARLVVAPASRGSKQAADRCQRDHAPRYLAP